MTTDQRIETLISEVEQAVKAGMAFFESAADSEARVDIWTPREVLCHMIYWHQATAEGMESAASGNGPQQIYADTDEMNARSVGRASGKSVANLLEEMSAAQERLIAAARAMPDINAVVMHREGNDLTGAQRLETIVNHWNGHVDEMKAAG